MPQTPLSSTTTYCTAARFLVRVDWRTVADLISDTGERVESAEAVKLHPNLTAALRAASGELETAVMVGGRYIPEDLREIADDSPSTNATELLADIVAGLALRRIFRRRPNDRPMPGLAAEAGEWLEKAMSGQRIFATQESSDAGVVDSVTETATVIGRRQMVTRQAARYFSRRADRSDPARQ